MRQFSTQYIFSFAAGLCLVCSMLISVSEVALREKQEINRVLDRKKSVLQACRMIGPEEHLSAAEILERFKSVEPHVIDLATGKYVDSIDANAFDPEKAQKTQAPPNSAQIKEIPVQVKVFHVKDGNAVKMIVLPIVGKGLWGDLKGYLALNADTNTVEGLTYYEHVETPGLGGEVDNPRWKGLWPGRKVYDEQGHVAIRVLKGRAGPVAEDPHHVDGLSGATITSRGVTNMMKFWMSEQGYGPYLAKFREKRPQGSA